MTTNSSTNISGINTSVATQSTNTAQYFNNFYSIPFSVSAATNDALTAFFEQYASNAQAAHTLASTVLYTALAQNLDPLAILSQFENLPKKQLTQYLVAFLNTTREPTSMLGINYGIAPSPYVMRTILV